MTEVNTIDQTENKIDGFEQAQLILSHLPAEHHQLKPWLRWSADIFKDQTWQEQLNQMMTIAYARMALRNGILSQHPRSYHNEIHINDLLTRIIYCAERFSDKLTPNGLAILSFFAASHDLRQNEPRNNLNPDSLVGANEKASYLEALRIINLTGTCTLWTEHHLLLLKTMIEGSTFGSGGKRSKNFFQGNLAKHLLNQLKLPNKNDEQLVLLGCDIDTANVSLAIDEFAQSAIDIYDELISHQKVEISAHQFFSQQQNTYFFKQQQFNANITKVLFEPKKQDNTEKLLALSEHINQLDKNLPATQIKAEFLNKAHNLAYQ